MKVLGIDVGGSAFKGAPVDTKTGRLLAERFRVEVDSPCPTAQGLKAARQIARHFKWRGPVGIGFPGIVLGSRTGPVANLGHNWEDKNIASLFSRATGGRARVLNDADAAGLAEMKWGAGRGCKGSVLMLTMGTGIGSALFFQGRLMPNLEFGHIPWRGKSIERFASAAVKKRRHLSWRQWARRVNVFLRVAERLCSPDLIIIGGGVSRKSDEWFKFLKARARVVPAKFHNDAGIVGAALGWEHVGIRE
jgi:polyphosphate glucokinase